jgi:hypothetical protein
LPFLQDHFDFQEASQAFHFVYMNSSLAHDVQTSHFFNRAGGARYLLQNFQQSPWIRRPRDLVIGAARAGRVSPFVED